MLFVQMKSGLDHKVRLNLFIEQQACCLFRRRAMFTINSHQTVTKQQACCLFRWRAVFTLVRPQKRNRLVLLVVKGGEGTKLSLALGKVSW